VLLTLYFHRTITGPIERLNRRLAEVSLSRTLPPLPSPRKDEIGELYRYVREMEQRIHESRQEQADMAGAIAHDLRTPLTSMNGFLELLHTHKDMTARQQEEYIGLIRKKSQHMTELIQQFSVHASYESEAQSLRLTPVPLAALFENIALEYEAELSGLDHELKWKHQFQSGQQGELNEAMTRRVFANLFSNAVRYGGKDQLVIAMNGFVQGRKAVITIEDDGVGVPESELSAIFRKFYTVDKSRQSERGGTGMGLATCHWIMEQQGGSIAAFVSACGGLGIRLEFAVSL